MSADRMSRARTEDRPVLRFLLSCHRWVRFWTWSLGLAVVCALIGIAPSVAAAVGVMGIVWVPILVLVFWGRLLDETMHFRSDEEDGPR